MYSVGPFGWRKEPVKNDRWHAALDNRKAEKNFYLAIVHPASLSYISHSSYRDFKTTNATHNNIFDKNSVTNLLTMSSQLIYTGGISRNNRRNVDVAVTSEVSASASASATSALVLMDDVMAMQNEYEARIRALEQENLLLRKQQVQISTAKELYLKIFDDFPALIWRSRLDKMCDYFNKTWLEWTGHTFEHEFGNGWTTGVHPDEFDQCVATYVAAFDKRNPFYMEYRLKNKYGQYRWIGDHGQPFYDLDGTFLGYIGSCYDIHDNKLSEERLLGAKKRAEDADQLKSAFLANMSHEIRTPLNGIIGHIDLALSNDLSSSHREENLDGMNIAKQSGALLLSIIQDILDLSKIEAGQMDMNHDEVYSLKAVTEHTQSLASTLLKQKGKEHIQFLVDMDSSLEEVVLGDRFRLHQVINNLVSNAIKFTDNGEVAFQIRLVPEETGDKAGKPRLKFSVRDTGKGIPEAHLKSIFEPFRQVEIGDTREHGGTGLGLTISHHLVEMMGGDLRVESSMGGVDSGSTFTFALPYRPAGGECATRLDNSNRGTERQSNRKLSKKDGKILVAEDDNVSRRLAHRMLTNAGYNVLLAKDGEEAIEVYKEHRSEITLILMDVQMPRLDGLHATQRIRALEAEAMGELGDFDLPNEDALPIIALSAGAMKGDEERGLAFGMTDYLTKPLNRKLLLATLESYHSKEEGEGGI